jgi:ubiquitin carboxyl-terminal hydrolase 9/24
LGIGTHRLDSQLFCILVFFQATGVMPDQSVVLALQQVAWSASAGALQLVHSPNDQIHQAVNQLHGAVSPGDGDRASPDADDVAVCREALEVLTICLALCPEAVEIMFKDRAWQTFIIDILLICRSR